MEPVGAYLCRDLNPDDTAARKLRMVECIYPFADLVDALLRSWAMHAGVHDDSEQGGEG